MDLRTLIYEELNKLIAQLQDNLSYGNYTHEEYKRICGKIDGVRSALVIIEETYRKYLAE